MLGQRKGPTRCLGAVKTFKGRSSRMKTATARTYLAIWTSIKLVKLHSNCVNVSMCEMCGARDFTLLRTKPATQAANFLPFLVATRFIFIEKKQRYNFPCEATIAPQVKPPKKYMQGCFAHWWALETLIVCLGFLKSPLFVLMNERPGWNCRLTYIVWVHFTARYFLHDGIDKILGKCEHGSMQCLNLIYVACQLRQKNLLHFTHVRLQQRTLTSCNISPTAESPHF